ncbi:MAG: hypothetical protein KBH78_11400 [Candidatus Hydrogenedentes bacterium]|nr:hypothetical protein [Candidatus Hydrogenedentota bacterium]
MSGNANAPGRSERNATDGPQQSKERLSFQDLVGEWGDLPVSPSRGDALELFHPEKQGDEVEPGASQGMDLEDSERFGTISGDMPARPTRRKRDENPLNARVLTESGARKTPLWAQTLYMALAAWLSLVPIWTGMLASVLQPWYSYSVMTLGGGAAFWAAYGMYHEDTAPLRFYCLGGLVLGMGAAVMAFLMRGWGIML